MAKRKKPHSGSGGRSQNHRSERSGRPERQPGGGKLWLYGFHAVIAALGNPRRKSYRLLINQDRADSFDLGEHANVDNIEPEFVERQEFERHLAPDAVHQGMALLVDPLEDEAIETICREAESKPGENEIIIALDQVTDPRNIGAIMRSATAFGARAIIMPEKHTPEATAALAKAASGALDRLPMVRVTNLTRALGLLKESGFWTVGLDANADQTLAEAKLDGKLVVVMGAEGDGLRRLTQENCDFLVKIPIDPTADSLNVSAAAAITLYEIVRSR